jgi:8-oxo-dGTP pyrophosphatase MutT (NUDIX family)
MTVDALRRALMRPGQASSDLDLNAGQWPSQGPALRPAAVLLAVCERPAGPSVLLTKRASGLQHHPGQIALPGGKIDPTDASAEAAALRESQEEVGLPPDVVSILGRLPPHETVTGFSITPVLGHVRKDFSPLIEAGEVDEAFFVPLAHLADPARYHIEKRMWRGTWRRYYCAPWGPYYVWGATARILRGLAERLT